MGFNKFLSSTACVSFVGAEFYCFYFAFYCRSMQMPTIFESFPTLTTMITIPGVWGRVPGNWVFGKVDIKVVIPLPASTQVC